VRKKNKNYFLNRLQQPCLYADRNIKPYSLTHSLTQLPRSQWRVKDLVAGRVVGDLRFRLVVRDVEFEAVKRPRDENDRTSLVVEWKMAHVQRAVHLDDRREHPEHVTS